MSPIRTFAARLPAVGVQQMMRTDYPLKARAAWHPLALYGAVLTGSGSGIVTISDVIVKFIADSGAVGYPGWYAAGDFAGILSLRLNTASTNYSVPLSGGSHNTGGCQTSETATFRVKLRAPGTRAAVGRRRLRSKTMSAGNQLRAWTEHNAHRYRCVVAQCRLGSEDLNG